MDSPSLAPPATDKTPHPEVSPNESFVLGIGFAWELGYTIAIPAVLLGLGGGYLDRNIFGTSPLFLILGLLLAFAISFSIIASKIKTITRRMPKILPGKKKDPVDAEAVAEHRAIHDLFRPPDK